MRLMGVWRSEFIWRLFISFRLKLVYTILEPSSNCFTGDMVLSLVWLSLWFDWFCVTDCFNLVYFIVSHANFLDIDSIRSSMVLISSLMEVYCLSTVSDLLIILICSWILLSFCGTILISSMSWSILTYCFTLDDDIFLFIEPQLTESYTECLEIKWLFFDRLCSLRRSYNDSPLIIINFKNYLYIINSTLFNKNNTPTDRNNLMVWEMDR